MTFTPRVSAATGDSPQERSRSPKRVLHSSQMLPKMSSRPITVSDDRSLVNISTTPARSLTRNQCLSSSVLAGSEMKARSISNGVGSGGDWVGPPPSSPLNHDSARNPATPAAMMFTATPETMWSTPTTTVARPWRTPPTIPNRTAPAMPAATP